MKLKPTDVPATSPLPPGAVIAFLQFWRSWKDVIPLDPCNLMEQPFTGGTKDIESHRFSL